MDSACDLSSVGIDESVRLHQRKLSHHSGAVRADVRRKLHPGEGERQLTCSLALELQTEIAEKLLAHTVTAEHLYPFAKLLCSGYEHIHQVLWLCSESFLGCNQETSMPTPPAFARVGMNDKHQEVPRLHSL